MADARVLHREDALLPLHRSGEAGEAAAQQDEDEHVEPRTFTLDEVREMIRVGEVADMKTVVGLTLLSEGS